VKAAKQKVLGERSGEVTAAHHQMRGSDVLAHIPEKNMRQMNPEREIIPV
jgi:hypothetical protein